MPVLTVVPDVWLPDGTVLRGDDPSLAGQQEPRFWTAPPRHRAKEDGCPACANPDYAAGCGDYQSAEILSWAPAFGYDLDPWQEWWLTEACGTKPDGRWSAFEAMLIVSRQNGKNSIQLSMDVLTNNRGWTTIGEIVPGDWVYGSDGQPVLVTGQTPVFRDKDCYEVSFTDGSAYVVSGDHEWLVKDTKGYRKGAGRGPGNRGFWASLPTEQLARNFGSRRPDNARMEYRYRVRCDAVVQTPDVPLSIDPYLLGYWLGDGESGRAEIFAAKADLGWVEAAIRKAGADVRRVREHPQTKVQEIFFGYGERWSRGGFQDRCRNLGILGAKRIPEVYLTASPEQRLALLRGLMDSDGSIAITNRSPQVEFTTSLPDLAEDFLRLVRSLGIRVTEPELGSTACNGKPGKGRYRFLWTPAFNPFAMSRKAERWKSPSSRRHELMSITSVRRVPPEPVRCIEVDSPDHVFLLGRNFTPTHNCCLEIRELAGLFILGERMIIHTAHEFKAAAEHFRRVRDTVTAYDELRKRVKSVTTSHGDEAIELRPVPTLIFGSGGRRIRRAVGARLRFLARSRGSGRSFTADCVVYDEAMILSDEQVGASMPTMSAVPNPQMIYTASAGYSDSVQLGAIRRRVLRGDVTLMGAEWSVSPHLDTCPRDEIAGRRSNRYVVCARHDDRDDPRSWAKANPALGDRIAVSHVAQELAAMSGTQFDRERLGVGDWPAEDEAWAVVTEEQWQACALPDPGGATRPVTFAVDVDPDMISATIAACWYRPGTPSPGRAEIEVAATAAARGGPLARLDTGTPDRPVVEIPQGCHREGTAWIVPRLAELRRAWRPAAIIIPKNGPAAGLADAAANAGLDITWASSGDEAAAFALMVTTIRKGRDGGLIHLGRAEAPGLWASVASAETRDVGDGGRAWSRRNSESDITPVTAATLALWALNRRRRNYDPVKSVAGLGRAAGGSGWMTGA